MRKLAEDRARLNAEQTRLHDMQARAGHARGDVRHAMMLGQVEPWGLHGISVRFLFLFFKVVFCVFAMNAE